MLHCWLLILSGLAQEPSGWWAKCQTIDFGTRILPIRNYSDSPALSSELTKIPPKGPGLRFPNICITSRASSKQIDHSAHSAFSGCPLGLLRSSNTPAADLIWELTGQVCVSLTPAEPHSRRASDLAYRSCWFVTASSAVDYLSYSAVSTRIE